MAESTSTAPSIEKGKFSPFAGCTIFIIAGLLALGMIGFTFWMGTRIESTVEGFTEEKPHEIQQTSIEGKESEKVALKSKLVDFRHKIEAKKTGEMSLTADELNLAIVTFKILQPQRGNLYITSITEDGIRAEISNPINSKMSNIITGEKNYRYLNGTILIEPEIVSGAVFPRITSIKPEGGGSVPDEFIQQISKTLLAPFKDDKEIGPLFTQLSSVEIKDNAVVLTTNPNTQTKDPTLMESKPALERFMKGFAIIAVVFLVFIAAIIMLSRRKAQQSPNTD